MKQSEVALLELLIRFSYAIEVEPPTTTDVGAWWAQALKEIKDYWLFDLLEHGIFTIKKNKTTNMMREMLIKEAEKRQLLNALA